MKNKNIRIDNELIELEAISENKNGTLYRYVADGRICGAPRKEVLSRFPEYKMPFDDAAFDYLFEENGTLVVYNPDGSPASPFEMITEEEINN